MKSALRSGAWGVVAVLLLAACVDSAMAQPPGGGRRQPPGGGPGGPGGGRGMGMGMNSPAMLLGNPAVQKELKIDEEQAAKVKELLDANREATTAAMAELREGGPEAMREKMPAIMREMNEKLTSGVAKVLKPAQVERMDQIMVQVAGSGALSMPKVTKALKITKDQEAKLADVMGSFGEKTRELFASARDGGGDPQEMRTKMQELNKERDEAAMAILTAAQKESLTKLKGKPFDTAQLRGPGGPGGRGGRGGPGGGRPPGGNDPR